MSKAEDWGYSCPYDEVCDLRAKLARAEKVIQAARDACNWFNLGLPHRLSALSVALAEYGEEG